jgi:hypothetical protein
MKTTDQAKKTIPSTSRQHKPSGTVMGSSEHEHQAHDIQTQTENAARFGHSLSNIAVRPDMATSGSGNPLPESLQRKMEASFGQDLSGVRVHEDAKATTLGAAAYTQGPNIHFTPGLYQPHSAEGQEMIGHELAHVVQQRIGRVKPSFANGINADPSLEHEADLAGSLAAQGNQIDVDGSHIHTSPGDGSAVQMLSLSALKPSEERKKALKKYGLNLLSTGASGAGNVLSSVLGAALKGGSSGDIFNAFKESGIKAAGSLGSTAMSGFQGVLHPGQDTTGKSGTATADTSAAPVATAADTTNDVGTAATETPAAKTTGEIKTPTPAASSSSVSDTKTTAGAANADSKIEELKPWKPALQQIIKIIDS